MRTLFLTFLIGSYIKPNLHLTLSNSYLVKQNVLAKNIKNIFYFLYNLKQAVTPGTTMEVIKDSTVYFF